MILLIDDCKEGGWADIVARNAFAGLQILLSLTTSITELHIDFDLGDKSENGLYILKHAFANELLPNIIWIVSLNPPGRKSMENFLLDNGYKQTGGKFERK